MSARPEEIEENSEINHNIDVQIVPKWPTETDVPLMYANYFAVTGTGHEIILTFGEFLPYHQKPLDEETREKLSHAEINISARIAMSPAGLEAFYSMLKRSLESDGENVKSNE